MLCFKQLFHNGVWTFSRFVRPLLADLRPETGDLSQMLYRCDSNLSNLNYQGTRLYCCSHSFGSIFEKHFSQTYKESLGEGKGREGKGGRERGRGRKKLASSKRIILPSYISMVTNDRPTTAGIPEQLQPLHYVASQWFPANAIHNTV